MSNSCVPLVASGKAERMSNSWSFVFAEGKRKKTNYRNAHNLSVIDVILWVLRRNYAHYAHSFQINVRVEKNYEE